METPFNFIEGTTITRPLYLNADLATYNTACAGKLMTFGTWPAGVSESNKVLTLVGNAVGTFSYTINWKTQLLGTNVASTITFNVRWEPVDGPFYQYGTHTGYPVIANADLKPCLLVKIKTC